MGSMCWAFRFVSELVKKIWLLVLLEISRIEVCLWTGSMVGSMEVMKGLGWWALLVFNLQSNSY